MNNETKSFEPKLIPMSEIDDKAREIAVAWIDNYTPHGSVMPEIAQKQKLASDIINYHLEKRDQFAIDFADWLKRNWEPMTNLWYRKGATKPDYKSETELLHIFKQSQK